MIGGGVIRAMNGEGAVARIIVRAEAFVKFPMFVSKRVVAQLGINQAEIVVGAEVFGIDLEGSFEAGRKFSDKKQKTY